jgi:hypothetical protein
MAEVIGYTVCPKGVGQGNEKGKCYIGVVYTVINNVCLSFFLTQNGNDNGHKRKCSSRIKCSLTERFVPAAGCGGFVGSLLIVASISQRLWRVSDII